MARLFRDDSDSVSSVERFRRGMAAIGGSEAAEDPAESDEEGTVLVEEPEEPDPEEPDDEAPPAANRAQRKRNRYREAQEAREAAERTAEAARRETQEIRARLDQLQGYVAGAVRPQQSDPLRTALDANYQAEKDLVEEANRLHATDPAAAKAKQDAWTDRLKQINLDRARIQQHLVAREDAPRQRQEQVADQKRQLYNNLAVQYPDVFGVPEGRAVKWAEIRYEQLKAEGHPESMDTVHRAIADARRQFRLSGGRTPPTEREKARFVGAPRSAAVSKTPTGQTKVVLTADMRAMAQARYPKLDPAEAHKKFARDVVIPAQAKKARKA